MRRALWCGLLALAGCAPTPTQLVVVVDTDLAIPAELDEVSVQVTGPSGMEERESTRLLGRDRLPLTLGIAPSGDALGPIEVIAIGRLDGAVVVTRTHRLTLIRGESRMLAMHLSRGCVGESCASSTTCAEQGCVPIELDAADLPPWTGSPVGLAMDAGAAMDGAGPVDGAAPMDGTAPPDGTAPLDGGDAAAPACATAAECDDGNPCTDDACTAAGCANPPNDSACDDGSFCNGLDRCVGGVCTGAGNPCAGATVCDEAADVCTGCAGDTDCPADMTGAWGSCDFGGSTCGESGSQQRSVVTFACVSGSCVPSSSTESQACTRDTDGASCAARTCGDWGGCGGFGSDCDTSGTMSRSCSQGACAGGTCRTQSDTETSSCSRSTDGMVCEAGSCGGWSACSFADTCATSGTQTRTCNHPSSCSGGGCASGGTYTETQACTRASTDGVACGGPTCGAWGTCASNDPYSCDPSGTQTRSCTPAVCAGGTCSGAGTASTETQACTVDFTATIVVCDDLDECTRTDRCSGPWSCLGRPCSFCCPVEPL